MALMFGERRLPMLPPSVEVRSRRVGGATFQIPTEIPPSRKQSIGMKNLIQFARKRNEKSMGKNLQQR